MTTAPKAASCSATSSLSHKILHQTPMQYSAFVFLPHLARTYGFEPPLPPSQDNSAISHTGGAGIYSASANTVVGSSAAGTSANTTINNNNNNNNNNNHNNNNNNNNSNVTPGIPRGLHGHATMVCKHWLRGLCKKGEGCEFLHEYNLRRMPDCSFFSRTGTCANGDDCLYYHADPRDRAPPCEWYDQGFCPLGAARCAKRHVKKLPPRMILAPFEDVTGADQDDEDERDHDDDLSDGDDKNGDEHGEMEIDGHVGAAKDGSRRSGGSAGHEPMLSLCPYFLAGFCPIGRRLCTNGAHPPWRDDLPPPVSRAPSEPPSDTNDPISASAGHAAATAATVATLAAVISGGHGSGGSSAGGLLDDGRLVTDTSGGVGGEGIYGRDQALSREHNKDAGGARRWRGRGGGVGGGGVGRGGVFGGAGVQKHPRQKR